MDAAKKVEGVSDARIDLQSMQIILSGDEKIDLDRVIRSLDEAGFKAAK